MPTPILGNFNSYTEGGRIVGNYWYTDVEAFIQDNWRVSRRVTLDLGVRFYHQVPTKNYDYNTTDWVRSSYNPAQAMRLYYPGCTVSTATKACPTANQIAVDPMTGYQNVLRPARHLRARVGGRLFHHAERRSPAWSAPPPTTPTCRSRCGTSHSVLPAFRYRPRVGRIRQRQNRHPHRLRPVL